RARAHSRRPGRWIPGRCRVRRPGYLRVAALGDRCRRRSGARGPAMARRTVLSHHQRSVAAPDGSQPRLAGGASPMKRSTTKRRVVAIAGGAAVVAVVAVTAGCESTGNQAPSTPTTTTTTTTSPAATTAPPTEKNINPTGGNLFTPQVVAPPAPTEPPGVHRHRQN